MSVDYLVASLPTLVFGLPAPITQEKFSEACGEEIKMPRAWIDLETQLRNAMVEARTGENRFRREAIGCSIYWKHRILACFQEKNVLKRDEMLDRVWWDAAGEMTPVTNPLSYGALVTYAIRLKIILKRSKISTEKGNSVFDRITAETKMEF